MNEETNRADAARAWMHLETNLNRILAHLKDAEEVGNIHERADVIKRHCRQAKDAYDWLDSFCEVTIY